MPSNITINLLFTGEESDRNLLVAGGVNTPQNGCVYALKLKVGEISPSNVIEAWKRSRSYLAKHNIF